MKYPISIRSFEDIITNGFVYIDKTALIYKMVTEGSIYFLSRPRRFGKSLLLSTLDCYFRGRKELFKGLAVDELEKEWAEYPVFHIDFNGCNFANKGELEQRLLVNITSWEQEFGRHPNTDALGDRFAYVLQQAHQKTGRKAVVLIDEYDKPLLDVIDQPHLYYTLDGGEKMSFEEHNRNVLKGFYSVFKLVDEHLRFVLLTGVTKFSQISVFSGFNQPEDISSDKDYEALCGITKEEMLSVFKEPIGELAAKYQVSYEEMVAKLEKQYDGYHFGERMVGIFNPFSLLNCFKKNTIDNYWFASGTPTYLVRLLQHNQEHINELVGKYYSASEFVNYKADVEKPLPMIYQSGYLTIKAYDRFFDTYLLDFPNAEVRQGFIDVLASGYFNGQNAYSTNWLMDVSKCLFKGDVDMFMKKMTSLLASTTYRFHHKNDPIDSERYFHYTFYLILQMIGKYNTMVEKETSEGRIDCVIECPEQVYILEFKLNGSAEEALRQIEEKGYAKPYATDTRPVHLIGINFTSEKGNIEEYKHHLSAV